MADKISPASKPVGRSGGIKQGSANGTLTTPNMPIPYRVWGTKKNQKDKIFGK